MTDAADVLAPLTEVETALANLHGPGDLPASGAGAEAPAVALSTVSAAVETTLRRWLRWEPGVDEHLRMSALAPDQVPFQDVVDELRRQGALSLELASRIHVLHVAADGGGSAAAGVDAAAVVKSLRDEVQARQQTGQEPAATASSSAAVESGIAASAGAPAASGASSPPRRWVAWTAIVVLCVAGLAAYLLLRPGGDFRRGVAAFARGDTAVAERDLQAVVARDSTNVTALLYLARMARRGGRYTEAAADLKAAVAASPSDPDVRRELGHFFFDLGQYRDATDQFRRAVNLQPDEALNWVGLIRAMRALGDSQADQVLEQAPPAVRQQVNDTP